MSARNGSTPLQVAVMILLPLLVTAAAAYIAFDNSPPAPEQYRATVVVGPPSTVQDSAAAVNLFIADLGQRITADAVVNHVLDEVPQLDQRTYIENISADRRETASSVALSFVHSDRAVAELTVDTVARQLLDGAARTDFERGQFMLDRATERLDAAEASMSRFAGTQSVFDPEVEYRTALDEIAQLDRQITTGQALSYSDAYTDELVARRDVLEASLPRIGQALLSYRALTAELEQAQAVWEKASLNYDRAEFEYQTVNAVDNLISNRELVAFVDTTPQLQRTALAGAVALALSLVTIVPLTAWLLRRRGKHRGLAEDLMDSGVQPTRLRPDSTGERHPAEPQGRSRRRA